MLRWLSMSTLREITRDSQLEASALSLAQVLIILVPACFVSAAIGYGVAALFLHSGRRKAESTHREVRRPGPRLHPRIETIRRIGRGSTSEVPDRAVGQDAE